MDAGTVTNMLSSFGFPIVMCGAMGWFVKYMYDNHRKDRQEYVATEDAKMDRILNTFSTQLDSVQEALNNNTLVITKLCERMSKED